MLRSGRQFTAGLLLGLCAIKLHLFLLLPLFLLRRQLWKTIGRRRCRSRLSGWRCALRPRGRTGSPSIAWRWPIREPIPTPPTWSTCAVCSITTLPGSCPAAALVALLCGYLIWRGSLEVALCAVFAGGVLITPHTTVCDATLFLPGLLLARKMDWAPVRAVAAFALTPLYLFLPRGGMQVAVLTHPCWRPFGWCAARQWTRAGSAIMERWRR